MDNPKIASLSMSQADISEDDAKAMYSLMSSDGWKVLQRVWNVRLAQYGRFCVSSKDDPRFAQGCYQGFEHAMMVPEQLISQSESEEVQYESAADRFEANQRLYMESHSDSY